MKGYKGFNPGLICKDKQYQENTVFEEPEAKICEKCIAEMPSENVDSGYSARIGSSGDYARIGSSGYSAQIGSSGDCAQIGSSGDSARINCTGSDSVICCAGNGAVVKAPIGCWITLTEWKYDPSKGRYVPVCVKTEYVDGEKIKADTPYRLGNGEFVEVESDGD